MAQEYLTRINGLHSGLHESLVLTNPSLASIIEQTARANGLTAELVLRGGNNPQFVKVRREVARIAREWYSISDIGRALNRHHTSVLHWFKEIVKK